MCTYVHVCVYVHTYVCVSSNAVPHCKHNITCTYVRTYVCAYVRTYVCAYVRTYIYVRTYVYTVHTCENSTAYSKTCPKDHLYARTTYIGIWKTIPISLNCVHKYRLTLTESFGGSFSIMTPIVTQFPSISPSLTFEAIRCSLIIFRPSILSSISDVLRKGLLNR